MGVTVDGNDLGSVLEVDSGVSVSISDLTISGGSVSSVGGGGLLNQGTAMLTDCTLSGNTALGGFGGGLFNSSTASDLVMTECTISGNAADSGGGLYNQGTATVTNCTVTGNSAYRDSGLGNDGTMTITACTVVGNAAASSTNGFGLDALNPVTLTDTIVAGNTNNGSPSDIGGSGGVSGSYNLVGTGGSGGLITSNHNVLNVSQPDLGPLGEYGGPTETLPLLPGSQALGGGVAVNGVDTDQRGFAIDIPVDIGAFQSNALVVNTTTDDPGSPRGP